MRLTLLPQALDDLRSDDEAMRTLACYMIGVEVSQEEVVSKFETKSQQQEIEVRRHSDSCRFPWVVGRSELSLIRKRA